MSEEFTKQPQEAQTEELLLLDLFIKLRKAGLRLGVDEYKLLQEALQAGFGTDLPSLKRLCQAIWVKSSEDQRIYDSYFKQLELNLHTQLSANVSDTKPQTSNLTKQATPKSLDNKPERSPSQTAEETGQQGDDKPQRSPSQTTEETGQQGDDKPQRSPSPATQETLIYIPDNSTDLNWSLFNPKSTIEDELQVGKSILQKTEDDEIFDNRFILTSEYFPVTRRQMKQSWRYLRRPVREGAPTELDMEATINQVGYNGMLFELVLVPLRVNRFELLLLLDQDGSMVPFHLLSRQLGETLLRGGRLGKASIYYFHNYPTEYLYRDCYRQTSEPIKDFLLPLRSERSSILIFSDAGAARGGYSQQRFDSTKDFLDELQKKGSYVAWLNPMPREFWKGTTAAYIDRIVPMFEFSRRGLQDAIGVLRGRPTNFEGRTI